jgi:hypothetical protein
MTATKPSELTIGTRAGALNAVRDAIHALRRASYFAGHLHGWAELDEKINEHASAVDQLWSTLLCAPLPTGDDREGPPPA